MFTKVFHFGSTFGSASVQQAFTHLDWRSPSSSSWHFVWQTVLYLLLKVASVLLWKAYDYKVLLRLSSFWQLLTRLQQAHWSLVRDSRLTKPSCSVTQFEQTLEQLQEACGSQLLSFDGNWGHCPSEDTKRLVGEPQHLTACSSSFYICQVWWTLRANYSNTHSEYRKDFCLLGSFLHPSNWSFQLKWDVSLGKNKPTSRSTSEEEWNFLKPLYLSQVLFPPRVSFPYLNHHYALNQFKRKKKKRTINTSRLMWPVEAQKGDKGDNCSQLPWKPPYFSLSVIVKQWLNAFLI